MLVLPIIWRGNWNDTILDRWLLPNIVDRLNYYFQNNLKPQKKPRNANSTGRMVAEEENWKSFFNSKKKAESNLRKKHPCAIFVLTLDKKEIAMGFWQIHSWWFLIFITFFPRLTMLFAVTVPFDWLAWLGWLFVPHLTVAILATIYYWNMEPYTLYHRLDRGLRWDGRRNESSKQNRPMTLWDPRNFSLRPLHFYYPKPSINHFSISTR